MRIVLFSLMLGSHQPIVVSFLWRYLAEQGDDVIFLTWKDHPALHRPGLELPPVRFITKGGSGPDLETRGARRPIDVYRSLRQCLRRASEEQADVMHLLTLDFHEIPLLLATKGRRRAPLSGPKVVASMQWAWYGEQIRGYPLPKRAYFGANLWALRRLFATERLRSLVVHTEEQKSALAQAVGTRFRPRVTVIPNPTESPPSISKREARSRLRLPPDRKVLLFFGDLRRDKGPDILLEALQHVPGDWAAVLAGQPGAFDASDAEEWRRRLDAPERLITRLEYIPTDDMHAYFAAADVAVLPYRRSFGGDSGVLQRAAEHETPVIVTDVGVVGAIVRREGLGIVVPAESPGELADGLRTFLSQADSLSREVAPRARDYARRSDWRLTGAAFRQMYSE